MMAGWRKDRHVKIEVGDTAPSYTCYYCPACGQHLKGQLMALHHCICGIWKRTKDGWIRVENQEGWF